MWIIIVSENLSENREAVLSQILNDSKVQERYLSKYSSGQWGSTTGVALANTWKTLSGAQRTIKTHSLNQHSSDWRTNKFVGLKGKHLQVRRITNEEWNSIIDFKLSKLKMQYERQKSKLELKKK